MNDSKVPDVPPPVQPIQSRHEPTLQVKSHHLRGFRLAGLIVVALLIIGLIAGVSAYFLYQNQLRPVSLEKTTERIRVTINSGDTPSAIAQLLQQKKLIRSATAFSIYSKLSHTQGQLKAGVYSLSPHDSVQTIIAHLVQGKSDTFSITFFPGATLVDTSSKPTDQKTDVTTVLERAGYSKMEITQALARQYQGPLFADKPASATLEGYVYGDTYQFDAGSSVEQILQRSFNEYYQKIQQYNIVAGLKQQGLNLYQGITLASIIQREMSAANPNVASQDQRQVAQVFYLRLQKNIALGSDVTAYYGASQINQPQSVSVDTPYNTRLHTGLPPGPIAVPSLGALEATAQPASGNYLFFLSGDDGKTYFATTDTEHEQNVKNHCQKKCAVQ